MPPIVLIECKLGTSSENSFLIPSSTLFRILYYAIEKRRDWQYLQRGNWGVITWENIPYSMSVGVLIHIRILTCPKNFYDMLS